MASHRQLGPALTGHTDWVSSVAFSPDGKNPGQRQRRQVGVGMEHSSSGDSRSAASWPSGGEVTMRTEAGRFCIRAGPAPLAPQNRPNRLREVKPSSASSSQRRATRYGKVLQPQDVSLRRSGSMAPTLLATARGACRWPTTDLDVLDRSWARNSQTDSLMPKVLGNCEEAGLDEFLAGDR